MPYSPRIHFDSPLPPETKSSSSFDRGDERIEAGREVLEALARHEPASKGVHDRRRFRDGGHQRLLLQLC